ncbi:hypothetical protein [Endozoicomonas lisbonensis]|uniref:Uncharacterized protein n=1 Tax=Endozoicomonas lisbonensis TaxID=3120522 RepID=A0ABV2SGP3_9GAMM
MQQAIKIKDLSQLVAIQKLRTQLAERDQSKRQNKGVIRRLVRLLTTQGTGIVMNGSLQKCLHCGRTGQEKIPVCCRHCKPFSRPGGNRAVEMAGRTGRAGKESRA